MGVNYPFADRQTEPMTRPSFFSVDADIGLEYSISLAGRDSRTAVLNENFDAVR